MLNKYMPENIYNKKFKSYSEAALNDAIESGEILEGTVVKIDRSLNMIVELSDTVRGVIPFKEFEYSYIGKSTKMSAIVSKVNHNVNFKVVGKETSADGKVTYQLSRREAQVECYNNYISKLQIGQVIDAKATYVESYGIFCDIGCGIIALLPKDSVCVAKIVDAKTELRGMSRIKVIVKSIDEQGLITLTHKELLGTWEENVADLDKGDIVKGKVKSVEEYGAFVEIAPNLVGLTDPYPNIKIGDTVNVFIRSIYPEKMKLKLMVVGMCEDKPNSWIKYKYYLPENGFRRDWVYSPDDSSKKIESHF